SLPPVYAELGGIVVGHKPGRENEKEQIINHNYGIGIHDVAMASAIYERAKIKKLGTELSLMHGDDSLF
ncbi:MAG: ornithine cyclodeaminase family protein, partial [Deltaproteobacteria bacterium]|nr:ornithine cyclodeaminase family protein [Deltaproteobacteria bacterium]